MELQIWMVIKLVTFSLCLCATVGLSIYSILRYCKNEDVTLVQISKYHSSEDMIYPSISICIMPPFLENKFDKYKEDGINVSSYTQFLQGDYWDERMLSIDYDNVTVSFVDNFLHSSCMTQNENICVNWNPIFYVSFRSSNRKCITIDAPYTEKELLSYFGLTISNDIFPNGARSPENLIRTYLHFPGQRFAGYYTAKAEWESRDNKTKSYDMYFYVKNVNVISRRNKPQEPCVENWRNFDDYVMNHMMLQTNCRPVHWNSTLDLPICSNATQMKVFARQPTIGMIESLNPPCKSIDRLDYSYLEVDRMKGQFTNYQ